MTLPDVTLILQIANFTIAYFIMRTLIFAPVLQIIQKQDLYKKSLEQNVADAKAEQHKILIEQKASWQKAKELLCSLIPKFSRMSLINQQSTEPKLLEPSVLSSQEKKALVEKLCDQLSDVKL